MKIIKKIMLYAALGLIPILAEILSMLTMSFSSSDTFRITFVIGFLYSIIVAGIAFKKKMTGIWWLPLSEVIWSLLVFAVLFYFDTRPLPPGTMRCVPTFIIVIFFAPGIIIPSVIMSGIYRFFITRAPKSE